MTRETQLPHPLPMRSAAQRHFDPVPAVLDVRTAGRSPAVPGLAPGAGPVGSSQAPQGTRPATASVGTSDGLMLDWVATIGMCLLWISFASDNRRMTDAFLGWLCVVMGGLIIAHAVQYFAEWWKGGRRGH